MVQSNPATSTTTSTPPLPNIPREPPQDAPANSPPPFMNSITSLRHLSAAFSSFLHSYDDLQNHLDLILLSIDSKFPNPPPPLLIATASPDPSSSESDSEPEPDSLQFVLSNLCKTMNIRSLRKYLNANLPITTRIRTQLPKALKVAPDPAELVLKTFGQACLQSLKAFQNDPLLIPRREAAVLLLECFLIMRCDYKIEIDMKVKVEAEKAAGVWRNRLISGGGLGKACEMDAKGLLILIVCFRVPSWFKDEDVGDLFWRGKDGFVKESYEALIKSSAIFARIRGIVEVSVKHKKEMEAFDLAYMLGVKFSPQTILASFLKDSKETREKARKDVKSSLADVNKANKKHLADLKSLVKLLEKHNIEPVPGWQLDGKILSLEKEIADLDKRSAEKLMLKRKVDKTESLKRFKKEDVIRPRFSHYVETKSSYDELTRRNSLDHALPLHSNIYAASQSMLHGAGPTSLLENIGGSIASCGSDAFAAGTSGALPTSSKAGVGQRVKHDRHPYGSRGDTDLDEQLVARYLTRQPPSIGLISLYPPSPSLQGFPGLQNPSSTGNLSRSSASDLYQFADTVMER